MSQACFCVIQMKLNAEEKLFFIYYILPDIYTN